MDTRTLDTVGTLVTDSNALTIPGTAAIGTNGDALGSNGSTADFTPYLGHLPFEIRDAVGKEMLTDRGFRQMDTMVPRGKSLLPIGAEKLAKMLAAHNAQPDLAVSNGVLRVRTAQEAHKDARVPIQRVRMTPDNAGLYGLGQDPSKALAYTPRGFAQVVDFVKKAPSTAAVLMTLSESAAATAFNDLAQRSTYAQPCRECKGNKTAPRTKRTPDGSLIYRGSTCQECKGTGLAPVVLRTVLDPSTGRRIIRATTSTLHSLENGSDLTIADALESVLPKGAKCRITRDLDRTVWEASWSMMDREIRVGDMLSAAIRVEHSETKMCAFSAESAIAQALCWNLTIGESKVDETQDVRHVGDLRVKIVSAIRNAIKRVEPLIHAFGDAYKTAFPVEMPTRGEVIARTVKALALPEGAGKAIDQAWDMDTTGAGNTLAGLGNALTRAAQEYGMNAAATMQRAAGLVISDGWDSLN